MKQSKAAEAQPASNFSNPSLRVWGRVQKEEYQRMETLNTTIHDEDGRGELFLSKLSDIEHVIMGAVADNDDALADRDIDAVTEASTVAAMLFTAAHAIAHGMSVDSATIQQQVREAMVGLSMLADRAFAIGDHDDDAWEVQ